MNNLNLIFSFLLILAVAGLAGRSLHSVLVAIFAPISGVMAFKVGRRFPADHKLARALEAAKSIRN